MAGNGRDTVRLAVRARDNFACQDCGEQRLPQECGRGRRFERSLDIHHLNGLCGKKSRGYDKLEDMKGLITLCHKCHYNRPDHSKKGGRKRTKEQDSRLKEMSKLRAERWTLREIGEKYNITHQRVQQLLSKPSKLK